MKILSIFLILLLSTMALGTPTAGLLYASDITFGWDANAEADIKGYRIYQKSASVENYPSVAVVEILHPNTEAQLSNLVDGAYDWVATAFDMSGNESVYSNEVSHIFAGGTPAAPNNLIIRVIVEVTVP